MKNRIPYLDFIRFATITGIVFGHVGSYVNLAFEDFGQYLFSISFGSVFRTSVPLIIMVSGILMLNKNKNITIKILFKKYIARIVLSIIFSVAFYDLIKIVIFSNWNSTIGQTWNINALFQLDTYKKIILDIITWNLDSYDQHLWFIYLMLIIYLLLPILKLYVLKASKKIQLWVLIIGSIVFIGGVNILSIFQQGTIISILSYFQYFIYYLCGYYLHNFVKVTKVVKKFAIIIFFIFTVITFFELYYCYIIVNGINSHNKLWIISSVYIQSISAILIISTWKSDFKFCGKMNKYMFGIYIFHMAFMSPTLFALCPSPILANFIWFIVVFGLSFLLTWIGKQIPFIKSYIF